LLLHVVIVKRKNTSICSRSAEFRRPQSFETTAANESQRRRKIKSHTQRAHARPSALSAEEETFK